jgi:NADH-quinone oxidoreductase subunit L
VIARFLGEGFAAAEHGAASGLSELALGLIATGLSATALVFGWYVYGSGRVDWTVLREQVGPLHTAMARGWFLDDVYDRVIVVPGKAVTSALSRGVDQGVIDRSIVGIGHAFAGLARVGRRVQTGFVRSYALVFLLGAVSLLLYLSARFR